MVLEELRQYLGKQGPAMVFEVEKGAIKRYAQAIGDDNPLYWDEEYARNSRYGSIIAPPGFFGWAARPIVHEEEVMGEAIMAVAKAGYARLLDGGIEYEFHRPVRAGDTLVATAKIADFYERVSKSGEKMILTVFESTYLNQNGDLVVKARHTLIGR